MTNTRGNPLRQSKFWAGILLGIVLGVLIVLGATIYLGRADRPAIKHALLPESDLGVMKLTKEEAERRKALIELLTAKDRLGGSSYWSEVFVEKLSTPLLTALATFLILAFVVPWANNKYWRSQRNFEEFKFITNKMSELYSELASLSTHFSQMILHERDAAAKKRLGVDSERVQDIDWAPLRLDVEPKLVRVLRGSRIHFGREVQDRVTKLRNFYNSLDGSANLADHVPQFNEQFWGILDLMENEIRARLEVS